MQCQRTGCPCREGFEGFSNAVLLLTSLTDSFTWAENLSASLFSYKRILAFYCESHQTAHTRISRGYPHRLDPCARNSDQLIRAPHSCHMVSSNDISVVTGRLSLAPECTALCPWPVACGLQLPARPLRVLLLNQTGAWLPGKTISEAEGQATRLNTLCCGRCTGG